MGYVIDNPVLRREVCHKLKLPRLTSRAHVWLLGLVVAVLVCFYVLGLVALQEPQPGEPRADWMSLSCILLALAVLLAPLLSAGAVSRECEQQTWEMLAVTRLSPAQVIVGKWLGHLVPLGVISLILLPYVLYTAALDNVSPGRVISLLVFLVLTAGLYGALGLACSFVARRTVAATTLAFSLVAFLCLGRFVIDSLSFPSSGTDFFLWLNPFYQMEHLINWPQGVQNDLGLMLAYAAAVLLLLKGCLTFMVRRCRHLSDRG